MSERGDAEARLRARREEFERRASDLRTAVDREVGWAPTLSAWLVPLLGIGAGLIVARNVRSRRRRRRRLRAAEADDAYDVERDVEPATLEP